MKIKKLDSELQLHFNEALEEVISHSSHELNSVHLISALGSHKLSYLPEKLNNLGIDLDALLTESFQHLQYSDLSARAFMHNKPVQLSDEVVDLILLTETIALKNNRKIMNSDDLMLALLTFSSKAKEILNNNQLTYNRYRMELDGNLGGFLSESNNNDKKDKKNGKTPVLDNFCTDITKKVHEGLIDPVIGRETEIKRLSYILSRRKKNNPILIGEPGTGKTAIVEGLARMINNDEAPLPLLNKKIYSLEMGAIVAGTKYRGQFEERMKTIIDELKNTDQIILYIDEIHTFVGAGNSSGSLDASNMLKPALARGEIQVIGATTLDEYREKIESDGALNRRFQKVRVEEPTLSEVSNILNQLKNVYEEYHNVVYNDGVIDLIVRLSDRYITDRFMPDKAIDIMDEAGAITRVDITSVPDHIKALNSEINSIINEKKTVVLNQDYDKAAELKEREENLTKLLETQTKRWETKIKKEKTYITEEIVGTVISNITGIPVNKISTNEAVNLKNLDKLMNTIVFGQENALNKVVKAIKRGRLGFKDKNKPTSFMFLGPTGSGKTFLTKQLAKYVYGNEKHLVRVDMSEYMEKFSLSALVGAPPGYVGHEEGGKLTEAVRRQPYSVVLFDEIEKAHPDIFNILLQILDEGHVTDGLGRKIDFKNTLIIMTSNIGVKELSNSGSGIGYGVDLDVIDDERKNEIIKNALKKKFNPEFLNRVSETITFNSLEKDDILNILNNEIKKRRSQFIEDTGIDFKCTPKFLEFLAEKGYSKEYGARPLDRTIQKYIDDVMADQVIEGNLIKGNVIKFTYTKAKGVTYKIM